MMKTILPPEMSGVMYITGYRGQGKSFLAASSDLPQNIAWFDFENKGEGIDAGIGKFGAYYPLTQMATLNGSRANPLRRFDITMDKIDRLEQDKYMVAVLDNISPFELAIDAEAIRNVDRYCSAFGLNKKNVLAGRYGGTKSVMNYYIGEVCNTLHAKGVQLVIATAHVKPAWQGGVQLINKFNMKGGDRWQELSILTLILVPGDDPPVPSAIVQKEQLGLISINRDPTEEELESMKSGETGHNIIRRLPYRMPVATFQKIRWYLRNPANLENPADGEAIDLDESNPFDEKLSKEQIAFVYNRAKVEAEAEEAADLLAKEQEEKALRAKVEAMGAQAVEIYEEHGSYKAVADELGISMPEAAKLVRMGKE